MRLCAITPIAVRIPPDERGPHSSWSAAVGVQILVQARETHGTVGWGGCFAYRSPRRVFEAVKEFGSVVRDRDFVDVTELATTLEETVLTRRPEARWAAAGIELAAWDLLGKQRGLPVFHLLRNSDSLLRP